MPVRIGVPRETAPGETRVALVPAVAEKYAALGAEVVLQKGAGASSYLADAAFEGVTLVDSAAEALGADVVLKVDPPSRGRGRPAARGRGAGRPAAAVQGARRDQGAARPQGHQLLARVAAAHQQGAVHGRAHLAGVHRRLQGGPHGGRHGAALLPDAHHSGRHAAAGEGGHHGRRRGGPAGHRHRAPPGRRGRGLRRALGHQGAGPVARRPLHRHRHRRRGRGRLRARAHRRGEGQGQGGRGRAPRGRRRRDHHGGRARAAVAEAGHGRRGGAHEAGRRHHRHGRRGRGQLRAHPPRRAVRPRTAASSSTGRSTSRPCCRCTPATSTPATSCTSSRRSSRRGELALDWDDEVLAGSVLTRDGAIVNERVRALVEGGAS